MQAKTPFELRFLVLIFVGNKQSNAYGGHVSLFLDVFIALNNF